MAVTDGASADETGRKIAVRPFEVRALVKYRFFREIPSGKLSFGENVVPCKEKCMGENAASTPFPFRAKWLSKMYAKLFFSKLATFA